MRFSTDKMGLQHPMTESGDDSILDLVYQFYTEEHPIENDRIRGLFQLLDVCFQEMSFKDNDRIFHLICTLCAEYERLAFLEGIHTGAKLLNEIGR